MNVYVQEFHSFHDGRTLIHDVFTSEEAARAACFSEEPGTELQWTHYESLQWSTARAFEGEWKVTTHKLVGW